MSHYLRASGIANHLGPVRIYQAWSDAVGREMAQRSRGVRFERGELLVEIESAAHMHELRAFRSEELRQRMNVLLGQDEIRRIQFRLKR